MKHFIFTCIFLCACAFVKAQSPQLISYQAVARDLTGKVLSEKPISVQVEILRGSNAGTVVYTETHELTTTKTGTINLLIGGGDKVGENDFSNIDWSQSPYFLRLGLRQEKESEYTEVVNTQMVSVPYALYAEKAGSVVNEGEEEPSDGTIQYGRDFILIPTDYNLFPSELYAAVGDGLSQNSSTTFEFNIVYLTGMDLKLTAKMDGFEMTSTRQPSQSTILGRYCCFEIDRQQDLDRLETKLMIVNENDEEIISFPIVINYVVNNN